MDWFAKMWADSLDEWVLSSFRTKKTVISNTFRSNPEPRDGYIDARRDDGCIPVITVLAA